MKKRGGGRPTKYRSEYCEQLVKHMAQGLSFESFAAVIEVNDDTLYEWVKVHPEFSDAKKRAFTKSRLFYEKMGIGIMLGKVPKGNVTAWIFNMKNRFDWQDLNKKPDNALEKFSLDLVRQANELANKSSDELLQIVDEERRKLNGKADA